MHRLTPRLYSLLATLAFSTSVTAQQLTPRDRAEAVFEAVRFLKQSPAASDWSVGFQNAAANNVFFYHGFPNVSGSVAAELREIARSRASVTLKEEGWSCHAESARERARCALMQVPFYAEADGPEVRADTMVFRARVFRRDPDRPTSPIFLLAEVWVVRKGKDWVGYRIYPGVW